MNFDIKPICVYTPCRKYQIVQYVYNPCRVTNRVPESQVIYLFMCDIWKD